MKKWMCCFAVCVFLLAGCSESPDLAEKEILSQETDNQVEEAEEKIEATEKEEGETAGEKEGMESLEMEKEPKEPEIIDLEGEKFFEGLSGAAVLYNPDKNQFFIYNQELAQTRRSPCSTFKIVSSLAALENGILEPEHSTRKWNGEFFWNENWNQDLDFGQAFQASCVWYFRELIDELGQERMQREVDRLSYGNCDISDWEGRGNTNNNNRALTGFWIEASLLISPKEQAEVMERIFGKNTVYSEKTQKELKKVMQVETEKETGISVYGKTGMGKAYGETVDAWFTGFAQKEQESVFFCIYLGRSEGRDVTSTIAKEIAIRIVEEYDSAWGD